MIKHTKVCNNCVRDIPHDGGLTIRGTDLIFVLGTEGHRENRPGNTRLDFCDQQCLIHWVFEEETS